MIHLVLYTTLGYHLCDLAEAEVAKALKSNCQLRKVDIADDRSLFDLYGLKIPVLALDDSHNFNKQGEMPKNPLFWPFTAEEIKEYINKNI